MTEESTVKHHGAFLIGGDNIKKHEKEVIQAQLDNEKAVLKQLERNYKDALEEVNSKIAELLGRADADMQHVIYQVEYQRSLKKQIEGILLQLQTKEFETVSEYLTKCYDDGFLGTMYALQSQGVPLVIPINQEEVAAAIVHETNLSSGLYKAFDTADLQKKIAAEISRGFTVGSSFSEIARNVAAYTNISKRNASRIVRTEGHRITETAAHHAQQKAVDCGADVAKIWDSTMDGRTRPSHIKVDGEIREVDEKFSNGLMFPGDPSGRAAEVINCRCRARTDAKWALTADETKHLGNVSKMNAAQRKAVADKLGIPEDALDQYSDQIVPIKAKNYADFKKQYNKLWHYEGSDLQKEAEARIAGYEKAKNAKKKVENAKKSSTIKSIDIDDFNMMATNSDITQEVADVIGNTLKDFENLGGMYITEAHFGDFYDEETGGAALFQVLVNAYGMTEINVNSRILGGRSVAEVDAMMAVTKINLPKSLKEAVVHECGHAKAYYGKTVKEVEAMNKALANQGVPGISYIASKDGAECIAEVEVLLHRGEKVPEAAMELYNKYVRGKNK